MRTAIKAKERIAVVIYLPITITGLLNRDTIIWKLRTLRMNENKIFISQTWNNNFVKEGNAETAQLSSPLHIFLWFNTPVGIETISNERLGRFCKLPLLKKCPAKVSKLRENSFQTKGPQLFNSLPKEIRKKYKTEDFKTLLDLSRIPDDLITPLVELNCLMPSQQILSLDNP